MWDYFHTGNHTAVLSADIYFRPAVTNLYYQVTYISLTTAMQDLKSKTAISHAWQVQPICYVLHLTLSLLTGTADREKKVVYKTNVNYSNDYFLIRS
jgi:cysteinyl-tRNA synthetase